MSAAASTSPPPLRSFTRTEAPTLAEEYMANGAPAGALSGRTRTVRSPSAWHLRAPQPSISPWPDAGGSRGAREVCTEQERG
eukprot:166026-Prorocentrum_minimum.AAC.1